MKTESESTRAATAEPDRPEPTEIPEPSVPAMYALFHRSLERVAQAEKLSLEMAARQSTKVVDTWKQVFQIPPSAPGMFVLDLATQAMNRYVEAQNSVVDLVVEQSAAALETSQRGSASGMAAGLVDVLQQSVERSATAQKVILDFAAQQAKVATDAVKQQLAMGGAPAAAAADSLQRGVDMLVQTQKDLMDIAAKTWKGPRAAKA